MSTFSSAGLDHLFFPPCCAFTSHSHSSLDMDLSSFPNGPWFFWGLKGKFLFLYPWGHVQDMDRSRCSTTLERWMTKWLNEWVNGYGILERTLEKIYSNYFILQNSILGFRKNVNWFAQKQFLDKYVTHRHTHTNTSLIMKVKYIKCASLEASFMNILNLLQDFFSYIG